MALPSRFAENGGRRCYLMSTRCLRMFRPSRKTAPACPIAPQGEEKSRRAEVMPFGPDKKSKKLRVLAGR